MDMDPYDDIVTTSRCCSSVFSSMGECRCCTLNLPMTYPAVACFLDANIIKSFSATTLVINSFFTSENTQIVKKENIKIDFQSNHFHARA